ncbi:MAG: S-layer homology domain-containing protein [Clostridia bacterium]|nr:S-layer homology domain-containing protein [Clostridia bacterium]
MKTKLTPLFFALIFMTATSFAAPITFTDVADDAWYYEDVQKAVDTGLISGFPDNTYRPDDEMTYAQAVKLAATMYKISMTGSYEFPEGTPWYAPYTEYAKNTGVISKDYDWNAPATRAGYMEIFANAIPDMPATTAVTALSAVNSVKDNSIPDVPMSHPQAKAIYKLYRAGIVQGVDDKHSCKPGSYIKRSEVAAIICRMMYADKRLSYSAGAESTLKVTVQPKSITAAEGDDAVFTVEVEGGKEPYSYQWKTEGGTGGGPGNPMDGYYYQGSKTDTLKRKDFRTAESGIKYWCVIADAEGSVVTSDKATVTVNEKEEDNADSEESSLSFLSQPRPATVPSYDYSHTFSVSVTGGTEPYTYQWYRKTSSDEDDMLSDSLLHTGTQTSSLTVESVNENIAGSSYYCTVTDADGCTITSAPASITIKSGRGGSEDTLSFKTQPRPAYVPGNNYTHTFSVTVSGGTEPYKYRWYRQDKDSDEDTPLIDGAIYSGTETETLTISFVTDDQNGSSYYCTVTDADGCEITSTPASLSIKSGR